MLLFGIAVLFIGGSNALDLTDCNSIYVQELCVDTTENCENCLNRNPCCFWCYQPYYQEARCNTKEQLLASNCSLGSIYEIHSEHRVEENKEFSLFQDYEVDEEAVQVRPQKIKVRLRYGEPVTLQVKYKAAENYPLDLYFLLDFTHSLSGYLDAISKLGKDLGEFLKTLTTTYKIALGFYADKVAMPYAYVDENYIENPCYGQGVECEKLFDFRHKLNFTNDINEFLQKVAVNKTTANVDDLEGGFDALMQVLSCRDEMKWRKHSRKIVMFTIAGHPMHTAGDGLLGGVTKKYLPKCHLDSTGEYTKSLEYDYPSLEEIYRELTEKKTNVLFLIISKTDYYHQINKIMPDFTSVRILESDHSNVLELIKEGYSNVVKNLRFIPTTEPGSFIEVTSESSCNKPEFLHKWNNTFSCDNIVPGEEYVFNLTLSFTRPPDHTVTSEVIIIQEQNIHESLTIEVEYLGTLCSCDDYNENICRNGNFNCGKCNCNNGWGGLDCNMECSEDKCRFQNDTYLSTPCFGQGTCSFEFCGCLCDYMHSGQYCQYPQCPRNNGKVCGGSKHGQCIEGLCVCEEGFSGIDCSCSTRVDTCTADGKLCNDIGTCECGQCKCPVINDIQYEGTYCERCPDCEGFCEKYSECVVATIEGKGDFCESNTSVIRSKELDLEHRHLCRHRFYRDVETCDVSYLYHTDAFSTLLEYQEECWKAVGASLVSGIIVAVILGCGLLFIIGYKVKITVQDRRELARFNDRVKQAQFDMNPLYNSPVVSYEVPKAMRE